MMPPPSHAHRVQSIFEELDAAGKSWTANQEGMTSNCMTSNTGKVCGQAQPGGVLRAAAVIVPNQRRAHGHHDQ